MYFLFGGGGQVVGRAKVQYFVYDTTKAELGLGMGVSFAISAFQKYENKCKYTYGTDKEFIPHFATSFTLFSLRVTGRTCDRFAS